MFFCALICSHFYIHSFLWPSSISVHRSTDPKIFSHPLLLWAPPPFHVPLTAPIHWPQPIHPSLNANIHIYHWPPSIQSHSHSFFATGSHVSSPYLSARGAPPLLQWIKIPPLADGRVSYSLVKHKVHFHRMPGGQKDCNYIWLWLHARTWSQLLEITSCTRNTGIFFLQQSCFPSNPFICYFSYRKHVGYSES